MITIYHNPRCRKSREGLAVLEAAEVKFEIVKYLTTPLTEEELTDLMSKLEMKPLELVRTKEAVWKENFKGKEMTDQEVIKAMADFPKLLERPVVVNGKKAVLGRPAELINTIL